jgi:cobyrinic acid a,c-diamide synthase
MTTGSSRLVIAGLCGDSGKTIASLSILAALKGRGFSISVFKKGPDYIDPAWLASLSQTACRNLDTYMVDPDVVVRSFVVHGGESDISVIEGNRGLFDGKDVSGTHSTAELAKLLAAPVVLVVDAAKSTRTVAAIVRGCVDFDPDVNIAGVILNRVAGERHLGILTESIGEYTGLPVLGAIPKLGEDSALIPGRHLGLVPPSEYEGGADLRSSLCEIAERYLDVDGLIAAAEAAGPLSCAELESSAVAPDRVNQVESRVKIGFFEDSVFTFYYPENLEALEAEGAQLVPISSLADERLPDVDALYIGGGFPETHAEQLVRNRSLMTSVKKAALGGLPIYAECGGLIYLVRSLRCGDVVYPMSGLFPIDLTMRQKPVGHGYASVRVDTANPFYAVGTSIRGHEFHYSGPTEGSQQVKTCMKVESGVGVGGTRDGLVYANTLACYTHVHADGVESWASAMVSAATDHAAERRRRSDENSSTDKDKDIDTDTDGRLESKAI